MACSSLESGECVGGGERRFVWPPSGVSVVESAGERAAPSVDEGAAVVEPRRGVMARVSDALWEVERAWLAPTALPLARRIELSGWRADAPGMYCDRCGETCGPFETGEFGCAACAGKRLPWDRFVRLGTHSGALREWVHEVKFDRGARLGYELGKRLGASLRRAGAPVGGRVVIVPVPAHWTRRIARGVDHAGVIALGVGAELRAPVVQGLARRRGRSQRATPASGRSRNVSRAFIARVPARRVSGATVILVDDVRTTGATLRACARALREGSKGADFAGIWAGVVGVASHVSAQGGGGAEGLEGGVGA
ncbi:MAG: ComF family protein [Phycisphaerales bacterium]